jgi:hypothetical protein
MHHRRPSDLSFRLFGGIGGRGRGSFRWVFGDPGKLHRKSPPPSAWPAGGSRTRKLQLAKQDAETHDSVRCLAKMTSVRQKLRPSSTARDRCAWRLRRVSPRRRAFCVSRCGVDAELSRTVRRRRTYVFAACTEVSSRVRPGAGPDGSSTLGERKGARPGGKLSAHQTDRVPNRGSWEKARRFGGALGRRCSRESATQRCSPKISGKSECYVLSLAPRGLH